MFNPVDERTVCEPSAEGYDGYLKTRWPKPFEDHILQDDDDDEKGENRASL